MISETRRLTELNERMFQAADNYVKNIMLPWPRTVARGPASESFKLKFGGKNLWILFHIELIFSRSTFFLFNKSCIKHITTTSSESTPR